MNRASSFSLGARRWPPILLLQRAHELELEATKLAGGLLDLAQRASVYRHLYLASGRNHAFPLIAAHGALWAGGYFRFGLQLGRILSWQYALRPGRRHEMLRQLEAFANVFRDINRRVCIDTYKNFYLSKKYGQRAGIEQFIPLELLEPLNRMHAAQAAGAELSDDEKRLVFEAHFRNEQQTIVEPLISAALTQFEWPLLRAIALRPLVSFAYFPRGQRLWFRNFASQEERIEKGFAAFDTAATVGWSAVDAALARYQMLPAAYFQQPHEYFTQFRAGILAAA